ncbi:uncharacterized protein K460DRAFT_400862 [Cucurbitaria berberidis CBS 394.84]|uniref:Clr5 domain-containing protein n=1 Tax=Cucurbitaria berberidis CBS 394.84 TaxID=1168544 RepID=A0A9P4LD99_9PLEO|nr:uncharacterized protein K460DRAFT_400862 [Cucurbitaria berberidis CBS 394.84]KAF1850820.1 hypothetical protein K460DRAFT_400862 [Cucurbitaria berberidis CBS 394.84]
MSMRILAPRPNPLAASVVSKSQPALTHTDSEWAASYHIIERLYVNERRKLRYVMQYMENEHGFKATEQMYKKRFAKWGFQKNAKRSATAKRLLITAGEGKSMTSSKASTSGELGSLKAFPRISSRDSQVLLFFTSAQTWSIAFYESLHCQNGGLVSQQQQLSASQRQPSDTKEVGFAFRLVVELLGRGRGKLAGKMARKAFLLLEDMLTLEGPALVWNLLEIMHHMVMLRHAQLFHILLAHLIALADNRVAETHPLPSMLRSLRGLVATGSLFDPSLHDSDLTSLLQRAWILNAEILFDHFDTRLFHLYDHVLWDSCSINIPAHIVLRQIEAQHVSSSKIVAQQSERLAASTSVRDGKRFQRFSPPRIDVSLPLDFEILRENSLAALRKRGNSIITKLPSFTGDTTILINMLAGLAKAKVLEESPIAAESRLHAGNVACVIRALVDFNTERGDNESGEPLEAIEQLRTIGVLREHAQGETHPQVVQDMWFLRDTLLAAGKDGEAQEVEQDVYRRVEKYTRDISH